MCVLQPASWLFGYAHAYAMQIHVALTYILILLPARPAYLPVIVDVAALLLILPVNYFLYRAHIADPGFIPLPNHTTSPHQFILDELKKGIFYVCT